MTLVLLAATALAAIAGGCAPSEPAVHGVSPTMRRLTNAEYHHIIADVFGESVVVADDIDTIVREDGLIAVGARTAAITPTDIERFDGLARSIATQVVNERNRATLLPCLPARPDVPDDRCARSFLASAGRLLYRRELAPAELEAFVAVARSTGETLHDFYAGVGDALAGILVSPEFLYVVERSEPDREAASGRRLTASTVASRLSFFLWDTAPDEELLDAARRGDLDTRRGLTRAVDRMLRSPRVEDGVRALFADVLDFDRFATLEKDTRVYASYTRSVTDDAREQILRTIVGQLLGRNADYRTLFTTRDTYLTLNLGRIYRVPVAPSAAWSPYHFPDDDPHGGFFSWIGFTAVNAHPGRSSPTLRGRALRERILCERIPDPPANVDFTLFNAPGSDSLTARERLTAHATEPTCAGCHKLMDPLGLALEHFDGAGQFRARDTGRPIDTSGVLDGRAFADDRELESMVAGDPRVPACLVRRTVAYARGVPAAASDTAYLQYLTRRFAADHYRLRGLLRDVALSRGFLAVAPSNLLAGVSG